MYALHDFEAENEDELSFSAGEKIVVMERDDLYGDGWFQVSPRYSTETNERGGRKIDGADSVMTVVTGSQHCRRSWPVPSVLHLAKPSLARLLPRSCVPNQGRPHR